VSTPLAFELLDRRALGGIVFTDPLGRRVRTPVTARAVGDGVRLMRKRPGELVILEAPGLAAHSAAFEAPPPEPPLASVAVVLDLRPVESGLAPRRVTIRLPRDPDPANSASTASLFQPIIVPMQTAPDARPTGLAAALRVSVRRADDGRAIEGALVRLRPEGGRPEVIAVTDAAGEALLLAAGVPLSSPGPGAVVNADIAGVIDAIIDPQLAGFHAPGEVLAARQAAAERSTGFIDPDDLVARLAGQATPTVDVRIAAGDTRSAAISWTAP
jgi:hypothetical protein